MQTPPLRIVMTLIAQPETAQILGRKLIDANLAIAVTLIPGTESICRHHDEIITTHETLVLAKVLPDMANSVMSFLEIHHPGQIPEILITDVSEMNGSRLKWVNRKRKES